MQDSCQIAFKEWGAICLALGEGRQLLILRKGGINEGRDGFRVEHREFWLFPTFVHETAAALVPEAAPLIEQAEATRTPAGTLGLSHYAVVTDVFELRDDSCLAALAGQHLWSARTVDERFHYRIHGLFALVVRMHVRSAPHLIPDSPHFAGCRSWVELPVALDTTGLTPVLNEAEFTERRARLCALLEPHAIL